MKSFIQNVKNWTKGKSGQVTSNIKETVDKMNSTKSVSVKDLASFILLHPETHMDRKEYLGLVFCKCFLKVDNYVFFLETRGKDHERVLECTVTLDGKVVSAYHSYNSKNDKIKVPKNMTDIKTENYH